MSDIKLCNLLALVHESSHLLSNRNIKKSGKLQIYQIFKIDKIKKHPPVDCIEKKDYIDYRD